MNHLIINSLIIIMICLLLIPYGAETFVTLSNLNNNNKIVYKFCNKLKLYDKPSEHTLLLRNFKKEQTDKNNKIINQLSAEIEKLQGDKTLSSVTKINNYKCKSHNKATKQLELINKARQNIKTRNQVKLNVSYANQ